MSFFCSSRYIAFLNSIIDCTCINIFNGLNIRDDYWKKWNGILRSKKSLQTDEALFYASSTFGTSLLIIFIAFDIIIYWVYICICLIIG